MDTNINIHVVIYYWMCYSFIFISSPLFCFCYFSKKYNIKFQLFWLYVIFLITNRIVGFMFALFYVYISWILMLLFESDVFSQIDKIPFMFSTIILIFSIYLSFVISNLLFKRFDRNKKDNVALESGPNLELEDGHKREKDRH